MSENLLLLRLEGDSAANQRSTTMRTDTFIGLLKFRMSDLCILSINDKACRGLGSQIQAGECLADVFEDRKAFLQMVRDLRVNGQVEDQELKLRSAGRWTTLSCVYVESEDIVEAVIRETTTQRKNQEEIKRLRNELEQFIYHASHELRSPLATMLGLINLAKWEKEIDSMIRLNTMLGDKVSQLDELLRNIASVAFNNNQPCQCEEIAWASLIESVLGEFEDDLKRGHLVTYSVDQSTVFRTDINRIQIILRNLISNSVQYANHDNDAQWTKIEIVSDAEKVNIRISDNGIGIEEKFLDDIFKMFFKATTNASGAGLGLYIVKAMVEKLEGVILVESEKGQGTTFSIEIPNSTEG